MTIDETKLKDFLKGAGDIPPCPTDSFVNGFLAEMDKTAFPSEKAANGFSFARLAAAFAFVTIGLGAYFYLGETRQNSAAEIAIASITSPQSISDDEISDTLLYGDHAEDAFAASLVGHDDISTLVSITDP